METFLIITVTAAVTLIIGARLMLAVGFTDDEKREHGMWF